MEDPKSLINAAYDVLARRFRENGNKSEPMAFNELLLEVGKEVGILDENKLLELASHFYTELTCDGRFVLRNNNTWVLRVNEKFESIYIDMNSLYDASEDVDEEGEKKEDEDDEENEDDDLGGIILDDEDEDEDNNDPIIPRDDDDIDE